MRLKQINYQKDQNKKDQSGADLASQVIETVAGVPIHYHVTADFIGFYDAVNALDGITVNVEKDLYDPYYPKDSFTSSGAFVESDRAQARVYFCEQRTFKKERRSRGAPRVQKRL